MTLSTTSESTGKDQVKLTVEVPESELKGAINAVYKRWATEIKVPGFRKGKVPRQLIDARVGPEVIREEALRDALPDLYREALEAESLEAIAPPDIEVKSFEQGSPLVFEATVDVRPEIELPDYSSVKAEAPSTEVTDEDIDEQLERLQDRFAELETDLAGRTARRPRRDRPQGLQERRARRRRERPRLSLRAGLRARPPEPRRSTAGREGRRHPQVHRLGARAATKELPKTSSSRFWSKRSNRRSCRLSTTSSRKPSASSTRWTI